jgi:hypothetical protein
MSSDNASIGKVREVLGSDADDVFHGLRIGLAGERRDVMVGADDISSLASDAIGTDLTSAEIHALPTYNEAATFHLASVGWLRKHIDWKEDSKSDEEPG